MDDKAGWRTASHPWRRILGRLFCFPFGRDADCTEDSIHVHARATKFVRRHWNAALDKYREVRPPTLTTGLECAAGPNDSDKDQQRNGIEIRRRSPACVGRPQSAGSGGGHAIVLSLDAPPRDLLPVRHEQTPPLETVKAKVGAAGHVRVRRRMLGQKPPHNVVP
jgi:hypothetical protein